MTGFVYEVDEKLHDVQAAWIALFNLRCTFNPKARPYMGRQFASLLDEGIMVERKLAEAHFIFLFLSSASARK
jgi:hypothetical protein